MMTLDPTKLIVAAIAICGISLVACKSAEAQLAEGDLKGLAKLSAADRSAFTDKCVARRADLFAYWFRPSTTLKPAEIEELKGDIDETFPRLCGCLVRELEQGLNGMQFMMAKTMINQGTYPDHPGSPILEFDDLKKAAAGLGVSDVDFEDARQKFRLHSSHSAEACSLTLWAPSLARKTGHPELRSYAGPPPVANDEPAARLRAEKLIEDQAVRAYSLCLEGSARKLSRDSNDPPDVIEPAALALCAKNRQMVFETYSNHANSFSSEMMSDLEQLFQRKLPQLATKARELRDTQPTLAPAKR